MSSDPNYRVADAIRKVALRLEEAFQTGKVDSIDANQLSEIFLLIAEELDREELKIPTLKTNSL